MHTKAFHGIKMSCTPQTARAVCTHTNTPSSSTVHTHTHTHTHTYTHAQTHTHTHACACAPMHPPGFPWRQGAVQLGPRGHSA